jgi:hypothetical protein
MIVNRIFIFLILSTFSNLFAQDATYFLSGKSAPIEVENLEGEKATYFLPGKETYEDQTEAIEADENGIFYSLPGSVKELDKSFTGDQEDSEAFLANPRPEKAQEFSVGHLKDESISQLPAGSAGNEKSEFETIDNMSRLNKLRDQANNGLSFSVLYDNFNYGGQPGVYNQLFEGSNKNLSNNLFFQGSYGLNFLRKFILLSAGLNLGVSYKYGKGQFEDGQKSETTIAVWAVPVDLAIYLQIPIGSVFRIEASAGPSLMSILQNRSDRDTGESGKDLYQISPGYFVGGKFKINWGNIFKSSALALFNTSDVTNLFLNFDVRYETYNKFSDEYVKVDGISYGLGLSFEFL